MNADVTALKDVLCQKVTVRVIDKGALPGSPGDEIPEDVRLVRVVQHHTVIAVVDRDIVPRHDPVRIHHRKTQMVADGDIPRHFGIVRIHVVHSEPQVAEQVVPVGVALRGIREDPVAAKAHLVAFDHRSRRVPDIDPVAAVVHPGQSQTLDPVALDQRVPRAVDVHADEVPRQGVVHHTRPARPFRQFHPGVDRVVRATGVGDDQPPDRHPFGIYRDDRPRTVPVHHGPGRTLQRDGMCQDHRAVVTARRKDQDVPLPGLCHGAGQRTGLGGDVQALCPCGRGEQAKEEDEAHQIALGSTNMRPRISMCSAWQNHWQ